MKKVFIHLLIFNLGISFGLAQNNCITPELDSILANAKIVYEELNNDTTCATEVIKYINNTFYKFSQKKALLSDYSSIQIKRSVYFFNNKISLDSEFKNIESYYNRSSWKNKGRSGQETNLCNHINYAKQTKHNYDLPQEHCPFGRGVVGYYSGAMRQTVYIDANENVALFIWGFYDKKKRIAYIFVDQVCSKKLTISEETISEEIARNGKIDIQSILFDVGSAALTVESSNILNSLGNYLINNPTINICIIGHTDSQGDSDSNLSLSAKRAESIGKYLIDNFSIRPKRLSTEGLGESKPIATNRTSEGRYLNRRVEIVKVN